MASFPTLTVPVVGDMVLTGGCAATLTTGALNAGLYVVLGVQSAGFSVARLDVSSSPTQAIQTASGPALLPQSAILAVYKSD